MRVSGLNSESVRKAKLAAALAALCIVFGLRAEAQLLHPADGKVPSFEVASIRPSRADGGLTNYHLSTARFAAENAQLADLIRFAYNIKSDDQLPRDPAWIRTDKFDIDAKVDDAELQAMGKMLPEQKFEQFRLMMRSLLADRFKLKVNTSTKELPVYALVVAKGGPHLTPAEVSPEAQMRHMPTLSGMSRGELKAGMVSMPFFTEWLSGSSETENRVVIDATGLTGSYNFTLSWAPEQNHAPQTNAAATGTANAAPADDARPSFITALEEQLGLKLEPRKAPVEVLVIDHVEQPSAN